MVKTTPHKRAVKLHCFWIPILLFIIIESVISSLTYSESNVIKNNTGIDVSECEVLYFSDDHGGFLGDGETFAEVNCTGQEEDIISQIKSENGWKALPATENSDAIISKLERDYDIMCTDNGYYYFYDRHSEATDPYSDEELFSRYSYNYTFALYCEEASRLYLYILDT